MLRPIHTACHTAHLHDFTGQGWLIVPRCEQDMGLDPGQASLHTADELAMLRDLDGQGYELLEDEDGEPWCTVGWTIDGQVFALYGREQPVTSQPTIGELAEAFAEFRSLVPLVVAVPPQRRAPEDSTRDAA